MPKGVYKRTKRNTRKWAGPMGNRGALTPECFEQLLTSMRKTEAKRAAVQERYKGLDPYNRRRHTNKVVIFSHLEPEVRRLAEHKYELYKEKHKLRLQTLPPKRRAQLLGSLAAAASRWAKAPAPSHWGYNAAAKQRYHSGLRTRLGLQPPRAERLLSLQRLERVNELQGEEPRAEVGSTNMEGV